MRNILIFVAIFLQLSGTALAESPLDPRRAIVHRDTDFPGGDIQSIFDTTLEACESACFTRAECNAYTYNSKSAACFLKEGTGTPAAFTGASSAEILDRPAAVLARAEAQAARLDFLHETDIASAERRARALPHDFPVGGWSAEELAGFAREAEGNANLAAAMRY
ncbi:MAG: hypothetical protein KDK11_18145, partial [Maritimibacter sp.]|nr:hypothetical protein [Maritimibacter sp.]